MKSETHSWSGLSALNCRFTLSSGHGAVGQVADRRANYLAADHPTQSVVAHQPLDGAACHHMAFAVQLPPDLVGTVDLHIGSPDAFDVGHQGLVAPSTLATQRRRALPGCIARR